MTPEQTQRWQEYGRARASFPHNKLANEYALAEIRLNTPPRQVFYVAMTAYRKELARKRAEDK